MKRTLNTLIIASVLCSFLTLAYSSNSISSATDQSTQIRIADDGDPFPPPPPPPPPGGDEPYV